jgi:hypothetical protein
MNCGDMHKKGSCSANQTAELEIEWTYTEGGFLCQRETSCELETPKNNRRGRPRKSWKRMVERKLQRMERLGGRSGQYLETDSAGVALWRPCALKWSSGIRLDSTNNMKLYESKVVHIPCSR